MPDTELPTRPAPPDSPPTTIELLAPAGDMECLRAAVENGANAVYFGLQTGFNARARAANLTLDELPAAMALLHRRGVRGYCTLNTLIFTSELAELEATVRQVAAAGVDAVLVQDLGAVRLIKATCPELPIHASTQMTLTSAETIRAAAELGVERVVLARELAVTEIDAIHREIGDIRGLSEAPLEAFVHGALCVAYSGQCMTSESLGGRSANRGQCAQACRLHYQLVCDGQDVDLGAQQYLLSPQDLAAFDMVPQLIAAGVTSFKIEGRLKTPEYVANITRQYRRAIDAALAGQSAEFSPRDVEEMELSFSRGFSHGWLDGCDHKQLVPGISSAKHGVLVGRVVGSPPGWQADAGRKTQPARGRVRVALCGSLARGDGVVFEGDRARGEEQGGRVYEIFSEGRSITERVSQGTVELAFADGAIDFARLLPGHTLWKTDEPQLTQALRKSYQGAKPQRRMPIDLKVTAEVGQPLHVEAVAGSTRVTLASPEPLAEARRHPLTAAVLAEQFGRLGGTNYELRDLAAEIRGLPMAPLSVLGQLRHALVAELDERAAQPPQRVCRAGSALAELRRRLPARGEPLPARGAALPADPQLHVLCRSLVQLEAVLACRAKSVLVDFQDIRDYAQAVAMAHDAGAQILLATPRIQKPDEFGIFRVMQRHGADGILVRNLSGLQYYVAEGVPAVADFSLNITNELTAEYLRGLGAGRLTASYDLNREQLLDLVGAVPPDWMEVVVHQHMPLFHMEHCVFCAVLSPGTNKTNCGRPCDVHQVKLRDRVGMEHPLKADVGCRNTLFNAVPQSAAEAVPALLARGVRHFRIELMDDGPQEEIARMLDLYRQLLAGELRGQDVWSRLKALNRVGVTRGTLEERRNPLAIL